MSSEREHGTIKWFSYDKGYGFVRLETHEDDAFLHISEVPDKQDPRHNRLEEGVEISARIERTEKGLQAVDVDLGGGGTASGLSPSPQETEGIRGPSDSARFLSDPSAIDNLSLALHKTVRFERQDDGGYDVESLKDKPLPQVKPASVERARRQYGNMIEALPGIDHVSFERPVEWRLAVGLRRASVYETNMTLHHTHGVPYVPGSGLKGAVRSFILEEVFYERAVGTAEAPAGTDIEAAGLADPVFASLFGAPEESVFGEARRGRARFYDAYPTSVPVVEVDIMNPHYRDYYMDGDAPTDDQDPTPISFLTVRDTSFVFAVGAETEGDPPSEVNATATSPLLETTPEAKRSSFLDLAQYWTERTLEEFGVGAKTATGYGYFTR
jgi:CRISPR-associated protein Cmr6